MRLRPRTNSRNFRVNREWPGGSHSDRLTDIVVCAHATGRQSEGRQLDEHETSKREEAQGREIERERREG